MDLSILISIIGIIMAYGSLVCLVYTKLRLESCRQKYKTESESADYWRSASDSWRDTVFDLTKENMMLEAENINLKNKKSIDWTIVG